MPLTRTEWECEHCGYSTAGRDGAGRCPECGLAMGLGRRFRRFEFKDIGWLLVRSVWPTSLAAAAAGLICLLGGPLALVAFWPPLLAGWILAAIGHPLTELHRFAHAHVLFRNRSIFNRMALPIAIGINILQSWAILTLMLAV